MKQTVLDYLFFCFSQGIRTGLTFLMLTMEGKALLKYLICANSNDAQQQWHRISNSNNTNSYI